MERLRQIGAMVLYAICAALKSLLDLFWYAWVAVAGIVMAFSAFMVMVWYLLRRCR